MRRLPAALLVVVAAVGVTAAVAQTGREDARPAAARPAAELPAANAVLPRAPKQMAATLTATTRRLRAAIGRWDPARAVPASVTYHALHHQRLLRFMAARRALGDGALRRLPRSVRGEARDTVIGLRRLAAIPRDPRHLPATRITTAARAAALRRDYAAAQRRFGIHWSVLAAINFVESAFGRIRSASESGAKGPMQFLPSTWRQYGMGGDIGDPHDAILGAANLLHSAGAPRDLDRALFAYNHSTDYVRAVRRFAARMRSDERAYLAYYAWQVFVRTPSGSHRVTGPGHT